ncbi:MAG: hypothetical protein QXH37_06745 [Candidatus Bathyarchaeia archaeon]
MSPKRGKVQAYLFFISIILFLLVFSNIKVASSSDGQTAEINASENDLNINVLVFLSGHYGLWEMNVRHDIRVNLTLYLREAPQTDYTITCAVLFSLDDVTGLPSGANYTYGFWGYPPIGTLNVYFPKNVSKASIFLEGHFTSSSVLWRNSAEVFFFDIASSLNLTRSYRVVLIPPSHARVLRAYSSFYPELACQKDVIGGADVFVF